MLQRRWLLLLLLILLLRTLWLCCWEPLGSAQLLCALLLLSPAPGAASGLRLCLRYLPLLRLLHWLLRTTRLVAAEAGRFEAIRARSRSPDTMLSSRAC